MQKAWPVRPPTRSKSANGSLSCSRVVAAVEDGGVLDVVEGEFSDMGAHKESAGGSEKMVKEVKESIANVTGQRGESGCWRQGVKGECRRYFQTWNHLPVVYIMKGNNRHADQCNEKFHSTTCVQ
jgi:hypothetical protein